MCRPALIVAWNMGARLKQERKQYNTLSLPSVTVVPTSLFFHMVLPINYALQAALAYEAVDIKFYKKRKKAILIQQHFPVVYYAAQSGPTFCVRVTIQMKTTEEHFLGCSLLCWTKRF